MLTENENLITLAKRAGELEHVIQVRFHHVLKKVFIDQVGKDGINLICIVSSTMKEDAFVRFVTLLSNEAYNNISAHDSILESIKQRIDDYIQYNKPPVKF